jgi:ABC-2 type transport system ATP-binding protein
VLEQLGLSLHRKERVETLSGGMRRRVDLAKTLIHRPAVLLLDEPSAGLDPGARSDLWRYLRQLKAEHGMTLVLTSHLLEEADRADRVAILHQGRIVAVDDPGRLRSELGGDSITIETDEPEAFCETLNRRWNCGARVVEREIRFASPKGAGWWSTLRDEYPTYVKSIKLGSPTLEDVFIQRTGHQFWQESATRKVR